MKEILIGTLRGHEETVIWRSDDVINCHWILVGSSGVGKSHRLRNIADQLKTQEGIRTYIFDAHEDLHTDENYTSVVKFSEISEYGINPLIIHSDPDYGGVRRRINSFSSMINRYSSSGKLGVKQLATLRNLMFGFYEEHGYKQDDPATWSSNGTEPPTLGDLRKYIYTKLKANILGGSEQAIKHLEDLGKKMEKLENLMNEQNDALNDDIEKIKEEAKAAFCKYVDNMETGSEPDIMIKYTSKDVLKSLYDRIDNLHYMGVFKDRSPMFSRTMPIWTFDIKSLSEEEQGYIVDIYLEKIFNSARNKGISKDIHTVIIIDEAHKYIHEGSVITQLIREGRKFGISLIFASQSLEHFGKDVITNCATKMILGLDETEHASTCRKFGIDELRIKHLKPRQTGLIQIKTHGSLNQNQFKDVILC